MNNKMKVEQLFHTSAKPPHFYNISFDVSDVGELYERIFEIYKYGAVNLFSDSNRIDILTLDEEKRFKLKEYMMSIGIKPSLEMYNPKQIHEIYKDMIYEIGQLPEINGERISASGVSKNGLFVSANLRIPKNCELIERFIQLIDNNRAYKDMLDIFTKRTELSDYCFKVRIGEDTGSLKTGTMFVLRFEFLH